MRFVAPLVGAWIEITIQALANITYITSHPSWVRGLKSASGLFKTILMLSHPSWVRGLKYEEWLFVSGQWESHPSWVRGLK